MKKHIHSKVLRWVAVGAIVATLGLVASPAESRAAEQSSMADGQTEPAVRNPFQIGLMSGPGIDTEAANISMSIGGHIEYKPTPLLGLGVFGMYTTYAQQEFFLTTAMANLTMLGAEAKIYPFSNDGLYLAGRVGVSILSTQVTAEWDNTLTASNSETGLLLGASVGYNFKLSKSFSMGPEFAYLQPHASNGHGNLYSTMMTLNYGF